MPEIGDEGIRPLEVEKEEVGRWTQFLVNNGARKVTATEQAGGKWRLVPEE